MKFSIRNNPFVIPIMLNIVLVIILYADYFIPSENIVEEKFKSFYNVVKTSPRIKGGGGREVKYILACKSGNLYYLYTFPTKEFNSKEGESIYIKKTAVFSKTKLLKLNLKSEGENISILSNYIVISLFILAFIISFFNLLYNNTFLDICLAFACVYIYLVTITYLFYL